MGAAIGPEQKLEWYLPACYQPSMVGRHVGLPTGPVDFAALGELLYIVDRRVEVRRANTAHRVHQLEVAHNAWRVAFQVADHPRNELPPLRLDAFRRRNNIA